VPTDPRGAEIRANSSFNEPRESGLYADPACVHVVERDTPRLLSGSWSWVGPLLFTRARQRLPFRPHR
jgi:hypothetical protein